MADVTGPISSLPGRTHATPKGMKCDEHPAKDAVIRLQGETDSFGCEMHDLCQECFDKHKEYLKSPEAEAHKHGQCEWCKNSATDLRDRRDFEEGMSGRIYRVCGACVKRENEELAREMGDAWDD